MADGNELILKKKTEDMLEYTDDRLKNFPKEQRYSLTVRIRNAGYDMLEIASDVSGGFYTMTSLKAFDRAKNHMEAYLNYAQRRQYITAHQFMEWGKRVDELGRINGGLIKALDAITARTKQRR